jgi:hypothetical protein
VPHGVTLAPQLLMVPRVSVPAGEYFVFSRALPRAGPFSWTGVSGVMRRLYAESRRYANRPLTCCTSTKDRPWASTSLSASAAGRGRAVTPAGCRNWSVIASWFTARMPRCEPAASRAVPAAFSGKNSIPSWWSPARLAKSVSVPSLRQAGVAALSGSPSA